MHIQTRTALTATLAGLASFAAPQVFANSTLIELSQDDRNWVMPCKDYNCSQFSGLDQTPSTTWTSSVRRGRFPRGC